MTVHLCSAHPIPQRCHCEIGKDHNHLDWLVKLRNGTAYERVPRRLCDSDSSDSQAVSPTTKSEEA